MKNLKIKVRVGMAVSVVAACALGMIAFANGTGALLPISDGNYKQWTPSTGTSHFAMVDEATCNGVTDYNRATTVGVRDSYGVSLSSIPDGATITDITIAPCASRNTTGGANPVMNVFYRWNGADSADFGNYSLAGGNTPVDLATTTASGLSLAKNSTSTLEIGAVYTSGTKGVRLSREAVTITYSLPPLPPTVTTLSPIITTSTGAASLRGSANPNGFSTTGWFRYDTVDPGTCDDSFGTRAGNWSLGSGTSAQNYSTFVQGLTSGVTYYYCAIASNTNGDGFGSVVSFVAP